MSWRWWESAEAVKERAARMRAEREYSYAAQEIVAATKAFDQAKHNFRHAEQPFVFQATRELNSAEIRYLTALRKLRLLDDENRREKYEHFTTEELHKVLCAWNGHPNAEVEEIRMEVRHRNKISLQKGSVQA